MSDPIVQMMSQVEDFEDFVNKFSTQMSDILQGKSDIVPGMEDIMLGKITLHHSSHPPKNKHKQCSKKSQKSRKQNITNINQNLESCSNTNNIPQTNSNPPIDYSKWDHIHDTSEDDSEYDCGSNCNQNGPSSSTVDDFIRPDVRIMAEAYKHQGNDAFKSTHYSLAIAFYDKAIKTFQQKNIPSHIDPALFTNRALAYLKLENYSDALHDCDEALRLDPKNLKAMWRRVEALKGLKEYSAALSELKSLEKLKETELTGVTTDDISKMIKLVEHESLLASQEKELDHILDANGSKVFMEQILVALEKTLDEHKNTVSQSLGMTCSVLMNLLESQTSVTDAFRMLGGFEKLIRRINPSTTALIMPIFVAALKNNIINRRHMSRYLSKILSNVFATLPEGSKITTTAMVIDFVGMCSTEEPCLNTLISQAAQSWTENLGVTTMTVLAMKRNSPRGSAHIYYAVTLAHSLLQTKKGQEAFFKVYKFSLAHFLSCISKHLVAEKITSEKKSFMQLCMECIQIILSSSFINKVAAINNSVEILVESIYYLLQQPDTPYAELSTIFHNIFIYLDHPITEVLAKHNLPTFLLHQYRMDPVKYETSLHILAKFIKYHSKHIGQYLGLNWSDDDMKKILESENNRSVKSGLQLLACWLQSSESHVQHWMKQDGFQSLVNLLKAQIKLKELDGYIIGNVALCLGECARKAENARNLVKLEAVDVIVKILRKVQEPGVQRNLAIACARLCQVVEGLERVRELKGIELMYGLGTKIVRR